MILLENGSDLGMHHSMNGLTIFLVSELEYTSNLLFEQSTSDGVDDDDWPQMRDDIFELFVQSLMKFRGQLRTADPSDDGG